MKDGKGFLIAGCVSIGLGVILLSVLLTAAVNGKKAALEEGAGEPEEGVEAEDPLAQEAARQVERFKSEYGMEIPLDDMIEQIEIRNRYEELYKDTYDLEAIFIPESQRGSGEEGDSVSQDTWDALDEIEAYVEKYQIDETRFQGMTPEEELMAIKIEYGSLEDEADSVYYDTPNAEGGEQEETSEEGGRQITPALTEEEESDMEEIEEKDQMAE